MLAQEAAPDCEIAAMLSAPPAAPCNHRHYKFSKTSVSRGYCDRYAPDSSVPASALTAESEEEEVEEEVEHEGVFLSRSPYHRHCPVGRLALHVEST